MRGIAVVLGEEDLAFLRRKVSSGVSTAREIAHARALLGPQEGLPRDRAAREAGVSHAALDLKGGKRPIEATERRTEADSARFVKRVVDELCVGARKVRLVLDGLIARSKAALHEAFEPQEAYRLAQALELRFAPRHGSRLDAVELESSAARGQCLSRRVASLEELRRETQAWQDERNAKKARVRWTFDVPSARAKLKRIYPANEA